MKFSDVKLLLPSSGYMKTSEVGGRTVIDEMRDASYERNHQTFAGDDRPELHQNLQGRFFTSVEKESTNLFLNSDTLSTQGVEVTADPYTVSFEGTGSIEFSGAHTGTLNGVEGERVETTFTPSAGTLTCTVSGEVLKAQIEQSAYATLYIPTEGTAVTRLAPLPVIDTISTDFAVIGFVCDFVFGDETNQRYPFFHSDSASVGLYTRDNNRVQIFADNNSSLILNTFGFNWQPVNTRKTWAMIAKFVEGNVELAVFNFETKEIKYNEFNSTGYTTPNTHNLRLAGWRLEGYTSHRFENYIRFNILSEETVKEQFERLLAGTSIETKASEMTII